MGSGGGSKLVLASRSPQRRAILAQLGVPFEWRVADIEEHGAGAPDQVAIGNALRKARAVASELAADRLVLGVDTIVTLDGRIYGKARDENEAREYLKRLSGRAHDVWSGLALIQGATERTAVARTAVWFRHLDPRTLDWYLETGEWHERAGAYAIQGRGAALVERVEGDFWNVVGLPVALLLDVEPDLLA
jgi:septum formation protein